MGDDATSMPSCRSTSDREEHDEMLVNIGPRLLKALLGKTDVSLCKCDIAPVNDCMICSKFKLIPIADKLKLG